MQSSVSHFGEGKQKPKRKGTLDPIKKILKVNDRSYNFQKAMNDKLVRILERYELDKPILMSDKLEIIWDKNDDGKSRRDDKSRKPINTIDDAKA